MRLRRFFGEIEDFGHGLPEPVSIDVGFAEYRNQFEVTGDKLRYSRDFIRREVVLPAEPAEE